MTKLLFLFFISSCSLKNPFGFSSNYRDFPIAVDCQSANDISLDFHKEGMPTVKVNENSVTFKKITDFNGTPRTICIFDNMTLLEFCQYKGIAEVAPYWVEAYQKINSVKCSEILK